MTAPKQAEHLASAREKLFRMLDAIQSQADLEPEKLNESELRAMLRKISACDSGPARVPSEDVARIIYADDEVFDFELRQEAAGKEVSAYYLDVKATADTVLALIHPDPARPDGGQTQTQGGA